MDWFKILLVVVLFVTTWVVASASTPGEAVYSQTCIACHGADGKGTFPGIRDLTDVDGPFTKSDEELINNILNGFQSPGSMMAMPPKGGNSNLTEDDIKAVVAFLRRKFK